MRRHGAGSRRAPTPAHAAAADPRSSAWAWLPTWRHRASTSGPACPSRAPPAAVPARPAPACGTWIRCRGTRGPRGPACVAARYRSSHPVVRRHGCGRVRRPGPDHPGRARPGRDPSARLTARGLRPDRATRLRRVPQSDPAIRNSLGPRRPRGSADRFPDLHCEHCVVRPRPCRDRCLHRACPPNHPGDRVSLRNGPMTRSTDPKRHQVGPTIRRVGPCRHPIRVACRHHHSNADPCHTPRKWARAREQSGRTEAGRREYASQLLREIPAATYSPRGLPPKYHRRGRSSLPCSEWERVFPRRNSHRKPMKLWMSLEDSIASTNNKDPKPSAD